MARLHFVPSLLALAAALIVGALLGQSRPIAPIAAVSVLSAAVLVLTLWQSRSALLGVAAGLGAVLGAWDRAGDDRARSAITAGDIVERRWHGGVIRGPVRGSAHGYRAVFSDSDTRILLTAAGAGPRPLPGDRIRVRGRLDTEARYLGWGVGGERHRLRAAGVDARLVTGASEVEILERAAGATPWRAAARLQRHLADLIEARAPGSDGAAVIAALVTGERSAIGNDLSTALRRAGVGHLLAVSGLHLGALAWLLFAAVRRSWSAIDRRARLAPETAAALAALIGSVAYAMTTGGRPSALRALVVVAVLLVGRARALRARVADALGAAALLLVGLEPALVFDPSFQMSFGAAAVLTLAFAGRRPEGRARIAGIAAASAWATAATAPVAAAMFGEIAPVAVLTNLVAIPLVALVVLPLAMAGAALSLLSPILGGLPLDLAIAVAALVCDGSRAVAEIAPALSLPALGTLELCAYLAGLAALVAARRLRRTPLGIAGALLCAAAIGAALSPSPPSGLRVTFVDVGQGDAALVELPGGQTLLIDAGGLPGRGELEPRQTEAPGARAVLPLLAARGIDRLDIVAVSHPHPDHHAGLGALVGAVDIGQLWLVSDRRLPPSLDATARALRVLGTTVVREPPRRRALGAASIEVLAPRYFGDVAADPVSSVNDNSLVMAVGYRGRRLLFTGDIEIDGEQLLLSRARGRLRADVVKVAHHGSRTSSSAAFIAATGASVAVISCGRQNRFGFPDPGVIARWRASGARVYRTDVSGSVELTVGDRGELGLRRYAPVGYIRR